MAKWIRKLLRGAMNYDPSFCDRYTEALSRPEANEEIDHIRRYLYACFGKEKLTILDAGCQAGRTLIPLAQDGHRLIGMDRSGFALHRTRWHAREHRLSVQLRKSNISQLRGWMAAASVDVVVCLEVLFTCRNYLTLLDILRDSVKPGGLLFISHRPAIYYVAAWLERGRLDEAAALAMLSEGPSPESRYHNWQTPEQLSQLYPAHHLQVLACHPVRNKAVSFDASIISNPVVKRLLGSAHTFDPSTRTTASGRGFVLRQAQDSSRARRNRVEGLAQDSVVRRTSFAHHGIERSRSTAPQAIEKVPCFAVAKPRLFFASSKLRRSTEELRRGEPQACPVGLRSTFSIPAYYLMVAQKPARPLYLAEKSLT